MDEQEVYKHIGATTTAIASINGILNKMDKKLDDSLVFQSRTEERLGSGANAFRDHSIKIEANELRLQSVEARKCPETVSTRTVVAIIAIGLTIIGLILGRA